jgi:nucleoside-diphosphate-sugar epimerase
MDNAKSRPTAGAKIVITGGAGFIGSHLCRRFLADGYDVVCIDNFLSGSKSNVEELKSNKHFTLIEHDVCQPLPVDLGQVDAILHFACPASPNPNSPVSYMNYPVETLMVSTLGAQRMLELAHENKCQIIFASTSEVYGDPQVHPQPETYWGNVNPNGPRSCYDEGKRAMEALAFSYYRLGGTKIKIIRIFNTYGPYMRLDDGRFTINLVDALINHKPFKVFGDGSSTRSFCFIDDLVEGIMLEFGSDKAIGEVINLGNPTEYTITEAIKVFEGVAGTMLPKEYLSAEIDDPKKRKPDITKAKNILGWEPKIDFATGMKKTLEYYGHE